MDSTSIEAALKSAAHRGVTVKVVMTGSSSWTTALLQLARAGVHVRVLGSSQVYIHAKVICVDCAGGAGTVFVGRSSRTSSTSSLSYNRELGIITTSPNAVLAVDTAVNIDYAAGSAVGTSDSPRHFSESRGNGRVTITSLEECGESGCRRLAQRALSQSG